MCVYQLKVRLLEISPMIWRRLLVPGSTDIAELHRIIQMTMGWEDAHLHRFVIYGKEYGISYDGGIGFSDNPRKVWLKDFEFRVGDKFHYEYDLGDRWEHEIRVEAILELDPLKPYPICTAGNGACPPEDCGGPWAYMERLHETRSLRKVLGRSLDPTAVFDRRKLNARLENRQYTEE